jgi:hypothetical protein
MAKSERTKPERIVIQVTPEFKQRFEAIAKKEFRNVSTQGELFLIKSVEQWETENGVVLFEAEESAK